MEISTIISGAALVLAILSPIISSWISGHYRMKELEIMKKGEKEKRHQEFFEEHRAAVIEKYMSAVGKCCNHYNLANKDNLGEYMGEIYLYVDKSLWPLIDKINGAIFAQKAVPIEDFTQLCKQLMDDNVRPKHQE